MIPIFVYFFPFFSFRFELASIKVSKVAWIAEDCAIVDKSLSEHIYIYIFRAAELAMSDIKTDKAIRFVIYLQ